MAMSKITKSIGRAVLTSAISLLDNPRSMYQEAKTPARKVLNKAIFTKLYLDDLGDGPAVVGDELNEPFATVIYARRGDSGLAPPSTRQAGVQAIREAEAGDLDWLEAELAEVWARAESQAAQLATGLARRRGVSPKEDAPADNDLGDGLTPVPYRAELLNWSLCGVGSSNAAMVRKGGLEPPHPKAPGPKPGASANSATPACVPLYRGRRRGFRPRGRGAASPRGRWP